MPVLVSWVGLQLGALNSSKVTSFWVWVGGVDRWVGGGGVTNCTNDWFYILTSCAETINLNVGIETGKHKGRHA